MGTDTILYEEIHQQPDVIELFAQAGQDMVRSLASHMRSADIRQVVVAARGTSDNPPLCSVSARGEQSTSGNAYHSQPVHSLPEATVFAPNTLY